MRARTLVGRMATIQVITMTIALGSVVVSSLLAVNRLVGRQRDRALMSTASAAVAALSDNDDLRALGEKRLAGELDEHRPAGVRIEAVDGDGKALAAIGEGPRLRPAGDDECANQEGWRVCERAVGSVRVLVGRSRQDEEATRNRIFLVVALASAAVGAGGALLSRAVARRGLGPLRAVSRRLESLTPGSGERLAVTSGLAEIDSFTKRFDALLDRVDEAVVRERRFAAQASHELRTPLTVLLAELEDLVAHPERTREAGGRALSSAQRLFRLVESLLLFGRADTRFKPTDLELLNLADIVRDELDRVSDTNAATRIDVDLADELLVLGDQQLLGRAISNLLDNAVKYGSADRQIGVSAEAREGTAVFTVGDAGPGIPPDLQERIFEPFFRDPRTRAAHPGHGLGLPFARAVARAHGGDLRIQASSAAGSVFALTLPLSDSPT